MDFSSIRCESCDGILVPPQMLAGAPGVRKDAAFVCLRCNRPYHWVGDPPRLSTMPPIATPANK